MKTQLRKDMDKEMKDKILLKDASFLRIVLHTCRKWNTEIWFLAFCISIAVDIWIKLGK